VSTDPVTVLVDAVLGPPGPDRIAAAVEALDRSEPDHLAFGGWRALLLLDDVVNAVGDGPWARRTAGLRRRSFAAGAVAGRRAGEVSGALAAAGIPHVVTGELALTLRYPRPGDRPVHGITVVTDQARRRVAAVLGAAGLPVIRFGRRSLRADVDGLRLLVHRGWPGAPTEPIAADPDPPGHPPFPVATPGAEARRIARPPLDPDGPADRLDLAALVGTLPEPHLSG